MKAILRATCLAMTLLVSVSTVAIVNADDYQIIAETVASPLFHSFDGSSGYFDDSSAMLRDELALQRLIFLSETDFGIADVRAGIVSKLQACHGTMEQIRSLDSNTPDYTGTASKLLQASPALFRERDAETGELLLTPEDHSNIEDLVAKGIEELVRAGVNAYQLSSERDTYRTHHQDARRASLDVQAVAEKRYHSARQAWYGIGVTLDFQDGKSVVTNVTEGGPAASNDVQVGDVLESIDDRRMPEPSNIAVPIDLSQLIPGEGADNSENVETAMTAERNAWIDTLLGEYDTTVSVELSRAGSTVKKDITRTAYIKDKALIWIDYTGSWHGTFDSDLLWLRNDSGMELTDVTIFVHLSGVHGNDDSASSDRHMHYLPKWPADESRLARYAASSLSGIVSNEAVDTVNSIMVEVYAKELQSKLVFEYANSPAIDEDIEALWTGSDPPQIKASYSADNIFGDAAVYLYLEGSYSSIPNPTVTLTVTEGERVETETFTPVSRTWSIGAFVVKTLQSSSFNGMNPDSIVATFSFNGVNFQPLHTFTFLK